MSEQAPREARPEMIPAPEWRRFLAQAGALAGAAVTPAQQAGLADYVVQLHRWNRTYKLVGPAALGEILDRHLLDSLLLHPLLAGARRVADIGSGAGLPGLILALFAPREQKIDLIESVGKKTRFLNQMITRLELADRVLAIGERAESLGKKARAAGAPPPYDRITARALGDLTLLATLAAPLLAPGGALLALKGRAVAEEIAAFGASAAVGDFSAPEIITFSGTESVAVRLIRNGGFGDGSADGAGGAG